MRVCAYVYNLPDSRRQVPDRSRTLGESQTKYMTSQVSFYFSSCQPGTCRAPRSFLCWFYPAKYMTHTSANEFFYKKYQTPPYTNVVEKSPCSARRFGDVTGVKGSAVDCSKDAGVTGRRVLMKELFSITISKSSS